MKTLISQLQKDYPKIEFKAGDRFIWSPERQVVVFKTTGAADPVAIWSLLHEVGHALLSHNTYKTDFNLVQLEVDAWHKAQELGEKYGHKIDADHIQDCLDTYRDWLYKRSLCPSCSTSSLQSDEYTYKCFNCGSQWHVSKSKLCRPYRLVKHEKRSQKPETSLNK